MAKGNIDGNKILVTGFTTETAITVNKEEIYKVTVSGTSTVLDNASPIKSNISLVRREKLAYIELSDINYVSELCSSATIATRNIKGETLYIVDLPAFVSDYEIKNIGVDEYSLYICVYQNYGEDNQSDIKIGGLDIYGHAVVSNEKSIKSKGTDLGSIELYYISGTEKKHEAKVDSAERSLDIQYSTTEGIKNLDVCETSGGITNVSIENTGENSGIVHIEFLENKNRYKNNEYRLVLCGDNRFGDSVVSNEFIITQEKGDGPLKIYIIGENIQAESKTATFHIIHSRHISDISVYDKSSFITEIEEFPEIGRIKVLATGDTNTTNLRRPWKIYASGMTDDGEVIYADGILFQEPGSYVRIVSGGTETTAATATVKHYIQLFTFNYTSFNVTGVSVSGNTVFKNSGGMVSVNQSSKTVTATFNKNSETRQKDYEIEIYGFSPSGDKLSAICTIKHQRRPSTVFSLTSGGTSQDAEIPYNTTAFTLTISCPNDYTNIEVFTNQSTSTQYKIYSTRITKVSNIKYNLLCYTYENTGATDAEYVVSVSGTTPEGPADYTNNFIVKHKAKEDLGTLTFDYPSANVTSDKTSLNDVGFSYNNLNFIYVEECVADDGSNVSVNGLTYSGGRGKLNISFTSYPPSGRTIVVKLKGTDTKGRAVPYSGECKFTVEQEPGGNLGIRVVPSMVTIGSSACTFSGYNVIRDCGVTFETPIYNTSVFSNVTDSSARMLLNNESLDDASYTITFRGKRPNGEIVSTELIVKQEGRALNPNITIYSSENLYDSVSEKYVISMGRGTYRLYIDTKDVDIETLSAFTSASTTSEQVTADTISQKITFPGITYPTITGELDDRTMVIKIPVGNTAVSYKPELESITHDVHEYNDIYLETGIDTNVWVEGKDLYHLNTVRSKSLKTNKYYITFSQQPPK